jgi:tetratricopeptide (TPR) repeat protein
MELAAVARLVTCFVEPSSTHNRSLADPLFARGLQLARALGDHDVESRLLWSKMVEASHYRSDEEAQQAGEAGLAIARQQGLSERLAYLLNDLAISLRLSGKQAQGQVYADEARTLFQAQNNLPMVADSLSQQAWSDYHSLEFASALRFAAECSELSRRIENHWNLSLAAAVRGLVLSACGDWGAACVALEESLRSGQQAGFVIPQTLIASRLGSLLRELGNFDQAHALQTEAYTLALRQAPFLLHALEAQLALDALAQHDVAKAQEWLGAAQTHVPQGAISRAWIVLADLPLALVGYARQTGEWDRALTIVEERIAEVRRRALPIYLPSLLVALGDCQAACGEEDAAEATFGEAIEIAAAAAMRPVLWQAHAARMKLYQAQERYAEAQVEQQKAATYLHALTASLTDPADQARFRLLPSVQSILR